MLRSDWGVSKSVSEAKSLMLLLSFVSGSLTVTLVSTSPEAERAIEPAMVRVMLVPWVRVRLFQVPVAESKSPAWECRKG